MHVTRQRLSNAFSIRAGSSCSESSRVVWDLQIQDWQEIPGQIEIGRAAAEIRDSGFGGVVPGESIGHGFKSRPPYRNST